MAETIVSIIIEGFGTWKKNLNICLPFVFSSVLTFVAAIIVIGSATLLTDDPLFVGIHYFTQTAEIPPDIIPQLQLQFLLSMGAIIIAVLLGLIINAFFIAGAIGMAKEAIERGKTNLSDMADYGRQKFISLLFANIIVGLIILAGVAFLIPGMLSIIPDMTLPKLVMLVYMVLVSIMFVLVPFAVVIGNFGAIEGVKKGFKLYRTHKLDVFLLGLIVLLIGLVMGLVTGFIPVVGQLINIAVSVFIILPLTVLWWTKFYMCVTAPRRFGGL
ncbi:hypothetical protein C5S31_07265 [ANME-1 cluster archaeon GoMg2]|nr:hypothetical protein [ANME-1 cluster archaeon GoMg2]NQE45803.1 hypothetical protein [ANME-1 cluster archaeon GoMg2]